MTKRNKVQIQTVNDFLDTLIANRTKNAFYWFYPSKSSRGWAVSTISSFWEMPRKFKSSRPIEKIAPDNPTVVGAIRAVLDQGKEIMDGK